MDRFLRLVIRADDRVFEPKEHLPVDYHVELGLHHSLDTCLADVQPTFELREHAPTLRCDRLERQI